MPVPTPEVLRDIFNHRLYHAGYELTVQKYERIRDHADGIMPAKLINERRPNESDHIKDYRKKIYIEKTKSPVNKVITELSKIRRSGDWKIQHPSDIPTSIAGDETLQKYCDENYPIHESVENYVFTVLLREYCLSGNSVCIVFPMETNISTREYIKPMARIFSPDKVLVSPEMGFVVVEEQEEVTIRLADEYKPGATIWHVLDETHYYLYKKGADGSVVEQKKYAHNIGSVPAWKLKGTYLKTQCGIIIYDSRLDPMSPSLDEAAREYSDLQAEVVQHIHSEKWIYSNIECSVCHGVGVLKGKGEGADSKTNCSNCKGMGYLPNTSPYTNVLVTPAKAGESSIPTPPVGYVEKNTEIVVVQDKRVDKHLSEALGSINMEYLSEVPLNQSGKAKEVDRESLNTFVYSVAEDLVWNMCRIYFYSNEYRNSVIVPNKEKRRAMLPKVPVPQYYDLLGATYYLDKVNKAVTSKLHPLIVSAMEYDYVGKEFYNDPQVAVLYKTIYELDPLPGMSVDDKMALVSSKGATQEDFVISTYIIEFVKQAMYKDKDFTSKDRDVQKKALTQFAQEKIKAMSIAAKLIPAKPDPANAA